VHQPAHVSGGEKQIGACIVGPDEPEPVSMSDDAPGDEVRPVDEPELAAAVADDLAIALHGREPSLQRLLLDRGTQCVRIGDSGELDRHAGLVEKRDQRTAFRQVRDTLSRTARSVTAGGWGTR